MDIKIDGHSIVALGKDGVIISADSRTCLYSPEDSEHPVGHIDTTQKLFDGGNFGISLTGGRGKIGGKFISVYVKEYLDSRKDKAATQNARQEIALFRSFISKQCSSQHRREFLRMYILVGGYFSIGNAKVFDLCAAQETKFTPGDSYLTIVPFDFDHKSIYRRTCAEIKPEMERSIKSYADYRGDGRIGGEILSLQLLRNGTSKWLHYVEPKYE